MKKIEATFIDLDTNEVIAQMPLYSDTLPNHGCEMTFNDVSYSVAATSELHARLVEIKENHYVPHPYGTIYLTEVIEKPKRFSFLNLF